MSNRAIATIIIVLAVIALIFIFFASGGPENVGPVEGQTDPGAPGSTASEPAAE